MFASAFQSSPEILQRERELKPHKNIPSNFKFIVFPPRITTEMKLWFRLMERQDSNQSYISFQEQSGKTV